MIRSMRKSLLVLAVAVNVAICPAFAAGEDPKPLTIGRTSCLSRSTICGLSLGVMDAIM